MSRTQIDIQTADGICSAGLFVPDAGSDKGVIMYMDAFGPRPALATMAERLTSEGYLVLLPDLYYRHAPYDPFDARTAFINEVSANAIRTMMGATSQAMTMADSGAFLDALQAVGAMQIGTVGYCMGGARALNAAAAHPTRIQAAASFHGGNLASEAEDSPHRNAAKIKARVYIGAAGVDRSFPPEQSARLIQALREAEVDHAIENYVGMAHGWAVPDHTVFDKSGAERHWKRLFTLLDEALD